MKKQFMPQARTVEALQGAQWDVPPQALERWTPFLRAAVDEPSEATISILEPIGKDFWTGEGVTAKRIAAALRTIGPDKDVTISINSPGGDLFEGMAIYNLLRDHKAEIKVKVLGIAASAASIVAMAGDEIQIARAGFFMVHNAWIVAMGNRIELQEAADWLEPFDLAMADIYTARTGLDLKAIQKKMDAETWINGTAAVDEGWADALLPADEVREEKGAQSISQRAAAYRADIAMAKAGMTRSERRNLMQELKASMLGAAGRNGTLDAADATDTPCAVMGSLVNELRTFQSQYAGA